MTRAITHDARGNVRRVTDETGVWVEADYDSAWGLLPVQTTNAATETTSLSWDFGCGTPLEATDANGKM